MAWKIKRKAARGRVAMTSERSIDQMAAFMADRVVGGDDLCSVCGKEKDIYRVGVCSYVWGCYVCEVMVPKGEAVVIEGEGV